MSILENLFSCSRTCRELEIPGRDFFSALHILFFHSISPFWSWTGDVLLTYNAQNSTAGNMGSIGDYLGATGERISEKIMF